MHSERKKCIFGLDIGVNSVGWAVAECEFGGETGEKPVPVALADMNSYIFQSGVDEKEKPRNVERRQNRLMRRQIARRAGRRRALAKLLQENGLLPPEWNSQSPDNPRLANQIDRDFAVRIKAADAMPCGDDETKWASPFAMRAFGLDNELQPHEIGRVCMHLQRRRGYFSNRGAKYIALLRELGMGDVGEENESAQTEDGARKKTADKDAPEKSEEEKEREKEEGKVLDGIKQLLSAMKESGCRTLGEYVWKHPQDGRAARITKGFGEYEHTSPKKAGQVERIGFYAKREMTEEEFDKLRARWEKYIPLSAEVWGDIREGIFAQFPVQSPPPPARRLSHLRSRYNLVGSCGVFPRKSRAAKARLESQEFRTRAVIANITADGEFLTGEQKNVLFAAVNDPEQLNAAARVSWTKVKELLNCREVNYSDDKDLKSGLVGNRTARSVAEVVGADGWRKMTDDDRRSLVEDMLSYTSKLGLYNRLCGHWKFSEGKNGDALKLAMLQLEPGYMKDSSKAIGRMLRLMRPSPNNPGFSEHDAREKVKDEIPESFRRRNQKPDSEQRRFLALTDIPKVANPRVERALFAVRRVVNALIRKYGAPAEIRLEMARDMKAGKKHRAEISKKQTDNRKRNAEADAELCALAVQKDSGVSFKEKAGLGKYISRELREKYKMWHYEQNRQCVYCGKGISCGELFRGGAEVEHIFPQSSFAQNYGNTVVACISCNREKGKRTPWQAFGESDKWAGIEKRAALKNPKMPNLPYPKRKRILGKKEDFLSDEDFVERALKDTQHIIAVVADFLRGAGMKVQPGRGQATAMLRKMWGLNDLLPRHPDDNAVAGEDGVLSYNPQQADKSKNRRDHRHHAVDAFVVAMTDIRTLTNLIRANQCRREARLLPDNDRQKVALKTKSDRYLAKVQKPDGWRGGIAPAVRDKIFAKVVVHQKMPRIRGALHKDSFYGVRFFDAGHAKVSSPAAAAKLLPPPDIRKDGGGLQTPKDGEYVADAEVWNKLQEWLRARQSDKKIPIPDELKSVKVKRACYVIRKSVEKALDAAAEEEQWSPVGKGNKYWIADKEMHDILRKWLCKHGFGVKERQAALRDDPPCMPSSKGAGNVIRSVRMATVKGANSVRRVHDFHFVEKRNNSHVEVFRRRDKNECKVRIVSVIDAAERRSQGKPVVDMRADDSWGEGWEWVFSLSENDMVRFDADKQDNVAVRDTIRNHEKDFGSSVYRVQKISRGEYTFRHCSVSGVDGNHGKLNIRSANDLNCVKIKTDVLGNIRAADDKADS